MPFQQTVKRLLRPLYGPPREVFQRLRARGINRRYAANYHRARELYASEGNVPDPIVNHLSEVRVRTVRPENGSSAWTFPPDYLALVNRIAKSAEVQFSESRHCMFLPPLDRSRLPERTAEVPELRAGHVISLQLREPWTLDGVEDLCAALLPSIERRVFGSYVVVDKVYVYRNLVSRQRAQVSWLWHYDNHPTEVLKVMIYLTDVDSGSAPFEYVWNSTSKEALSFAPKPLVGNSRLKAERVAQYLSDGWEVAQATGPQGTLVLFDDNVLHRATIATERHRDVLALQLRPATFNSARRVDPRWSGSFEHVDFNPDPDDYVVRPKRRRYSY